MIEHQNEPGVVSRRVRKDAGLPAVGVLGGDAVWSVAACLRSVGLKIADVEPAPKQISETLAARFQFGFASARCGALGDLRQILQLVQAATGVRQPKHWICTAPDGSFMDATRPGIDPSGFASKAELVVYRETHLAAVLKLLQGVTTLVLPLSKVMGLVDAADGWVYPAQVAGTKLARGCKLEPTVYAADTMVDDFATLHAALITVNPALTIRLVVADPAQDLAAMAGQGLLRAMAAHCAARFSAVVYDPVLDMLLTRLSLPEPDARVVALVQKLMAGGDLLDAVAVAKPEVAAMEDAEMGIPAPSDAPREKRDRAQRRAERANGKAGKAGGEKAVGENTGAKKSGGGSRVMCEDELLEAFS
ncbi:hypothetical protein [Cypionkella sp.]|uniref:hypothetical protein n=1 Tax=Cypionkella sp. TaxID=2811411 RepID=UPI002626046B|nr:hypothetical protein [Cypionkella sp.]MDB5663935.1 hypothetical protein [Cypionkella sp.]